MLNVDTSELKGIASCTRYDNGNLSECRLSEYNLIHTEVGDFVPQYQNPGIRRKDGRALSYYESGSIRSISLDEQTEVDTPLGIFPAELLTFYEDGSLDSLFPLNGQMSFSWSEEEEGSLVEKYEFSFPFGRFTAKIIGLRFYPGGNLRSLILWPGEVINLNTPLGEVAVRVGFKLYDDGQLESVEPAVPIQVTTPAGIVTAYNYAALAVDADINSLVFDRQGKLLSLVTLGDIFIRNRQSYKSWVVSSVFKPGLMEDDLIRSPIKLTFFKEEVVIADDIEENSYPYDECTFQFLYDDSTEKTACYGDCSGCEGCPE